MELHLNDLNRLPVHDAFWADDFCSVAESLREELIGFAHWKAHRLGHEYGFQTGITTGHIQGRYPELEACHRLEAQLEAQATELLRLVADDYEGPCRADFSGMAYGEAGKLSFHTDSIHGRHLAWVLLLTHPDDGEWAQKDGGALMLTDRVSEPHLVYPKFNRFIAFRVSDKSWHAIEQLQRATPWSRSRLALSGWLYS